MKPILLALCLLIVNDSALAQEENFAPPAGIDGRPMISAAQWEPLRAILPRLFSALLPEAGPSGRKALKTIRENLGMSEPSREALAKQIDETLRATGPVKAYDLVGVRSLPRGERLYRLAYLTYGAGGPTFWEATVYRSETGWKVLDLSVGTEKIFEMAQGYR